MVPVFVTTLHTTKLPVWGKTHSRHSANTRITSTFLCAVFIWTQGGDNFILVSSQWIYVKYNFILGPVLGDKGIGSVYPSHELLGPEEHFLMEVHHHNKFQEWYRVQTCQGKTSCLWRAGWELHLSARGEGEKSSQCYWKKYLWTQREVNQECIEWKFRSSFW